MNGMFPRCNLLEHQLTFQASSHFPRMSVHSYPCSSSSQVFPSQNATEPIATIMCKQESHRGKTNRGYIGMLSVDKAWRRRGIGKLHLTSIYAVNRSLGHSLEVGRIGDSGNGRMRSSRGTSHLLFSLEAKTLTMLDCT